MKFNGEIFVGNRQQSVKFYRRTIMGVMAHGREKHNIRAFLKTVQNGHMAWDEPTRQLFYRDKTGVLHKLNFEQVNEYDCE